MYAIIQDGSRQYKVQEGEELLIDYRGLAAGAQLTFDRVLACGGSEPGGSEPGGSDDCRLGQPALAGASVTAEVLGPARGPKLVIQKMRKRKNSRRRTGHRQLHTRVRISKIAL